MVNGVQIAEGGLLYQTIGTSAVEADPVIGPGIGLVGDVGNQLGGLGQEKITYLQRM